MIQQYRSSPWLAAAALAAAALAALANTGQATAPAFIPVWYGGQSLPRLAAIDPAALTIAEQRIAPRPLYRCSIHTSAWLKWIPRTGPAHRTAPGAETEAHPTAYLVCIEDTQP